MSAPPLGQASNKRQKGNEMGGPPPPGYAYAQHPFQAGGYPSQQFPMQNGYMPSWQPGQQQPPYPGQWQQMPPGMPPFRGHPDGRGGYFPQRGPRPVRGPQPPPPNQKSPPRSKKDGPPGYWPPSQGYPMHQPGAASAGYPPNMYGGAHSMQQQHKMPPWRNSSSPQRGMPPRRYEKEGDNSLYCEEVKKQDKDKGRGSYRCGRCGAPKKGHVCPYQPKLKRRPDEPPPEMRNAAVQVEMDEFMTLRRLNIEIQGFPESYATAPLVTDNMVVGEPHPLACLEHTPEVANPQQPPPPLEGITTDQEGVRASPAVETQG